jgi:hypothetical protein
MLHHLDTERKEEGRGEKKERANRDGKVENNHNWE